MLRGIARKSVGVVTCVYHLCCVVLKRTFEWDWVKCMQSSHGPAPCQCPLADHPGITRDGQSYSDGQKYSDRGALWVTISGQPWILRVTMTISDTLTGGPVADCPGTTKDSQLK